MQQGRRLPLPLVLPLLAAIAAIAAAPASSQTGAGSPPSTVVVPFAVEGQPSAWARAAVPRHLPPLERLRRLSRALLETRGAAIVEQPAHTSTATEVFAERRANCVGFANLFVGLARELGVAAYFVLVDGLPASRAGDPAGDSLMVREGHLAAAWGPEGGRRVFDFAGETAGERLRVRPITDLAAIAVFYSNRGIEALLDDRPTDAADWLRAAAELEPGALPSTWINLGVALRRSGELEAANAAYQRALELDPAAGAAYRNLAALLALRGQEREAAQLLATAGELSRLDALAALQLARQRLLEGHLQEARGLFRRALETSQLSPPR